jgi:hypothetical protein
MATSASAPTNPSIFDFSPQIAQDADLLKQFGFLPGLKELLMMRQVHALEHATVWVLDELNQPMGASSASSNALVGGMSTEQGFYLYGPVKPSDLRTAVHIALQRLTKGDWDLAVHPRCGTNLSVAMVLTVGLAMGLHLALPKGPIEQLLGLGIAATAAMQIAPDVGNIVQRHVTTAIPFNLAIAEIQNNFDHRGQPVHFVRVCWVE